MTCPMDLIFPRASLTLFDIRLVQHRIQLFPHNIIPACIAVCAPTHDISIFAKFPGSHFPVIDGLQLACIVKNNPTQSLLMVRLCKRKETEEEEEIFSWCLL